MIEINIDEPNAKATMVKSLLKQSKEMVVVCIGTENVTSDSLGPRVGSLLNENLTMPIFVYGMQGANIDAKNLNTAVDVIKRLHPNTPLLVVDAAVGEQWQVGKVQLTNGDIAPGAATNKQLTRVGDVSIVGIVGNKSMEDFYDNTIEKTILVEKLSQFIATVIAMATKHFGDENTQTGD
jgi:putative sporulation protein YyaC